MRKSNFSEARIVALQRRSVRWRRLSSADQPTLRAVCQPACEWGLSII